MEEIFAFVGAITGVSAILISINANKKVNDIKSLDLRVELKKDIVTLKKEFEELKSIIVLANQSREAISAAKGVFNSGMMEKWKRDIITDTEIINNIKGGLPRSEEECQSYSLVQLESELINIHSLLFDIRSLSEKYKKTMQSDEKDSDYLRGVHQDTFRRSS